MIQELIRKPGFILSISKAIRLFVSFFTFAIFPRYLGVNEYGLLAVIGSSAVFLTTLDLGFGQGLRNRINQLQNDKHQALMFYSVIFFLIFWTIIIGLICFAVLTNSNFSANLFSIPLDRKDLIFAANLSLFIFVINIPFSIQALLLMSYMEYSTIFIYEICNTLLSILLATILFLYKSAIPGYIIIILSIGGMALINILFTIYFTYKRKWVKKTYLPTYHQIRENVSEVFPTGRKFLLASICYAIVYSADSIIVAKTSSLEKAGDFRILMTVFQTGVALLQTYMSPLWDIANKHYHNGEREYLKKIIHKNNLYIFLITIIGTLLSLFFLLPLLRFMTGRDIYASSIEIIVLFIWFLLNTIPYSYSLFLNGISRLREQTMALVIGAVIKFPLGIFLGKAYGIMGVVIASCIILMINLVVYSSTAYKFLNKKCN